MKIFYWTMAVLIVGTFVPSVFFLILYGITGRYMHAQTARTFWNISRVFTLIGVDVLIWGHVAVGLWSIWFP